jgi:hypothetical protein
MANDRQSRRADRMARRAARKLNLYDFSGVSEEDFPDFINIAERINKGQSTLMQLNNDDLKTFIGFTMNSNPEMLKKLAEYGKKTGIEPDKVNEFVESMRKQLASPAHRQKLLQISKEQDLKNKTAAFSNAAGLLLVGADLASSVRQLSEYNRQLKEQKRPTRPGPMQADPYLSAAKKAAETGTFQESIAAKAARQQAFDAYQQDLQNSAVSSTGQAGAYGAQAQAAVTRLGRRGAEMAPQIEAFRNQRQQQYGQMAQLSAAENQARYESLAAPYKTDMEQYAREQASLAALGQSGRANLRTAMYDLGDYAALAATPYVNRKYDKLRAAMEARGMSPEEADKYAKGGSTPQVPTQAPKGPGITSSGPTQAPAQTPAQTPTQTPAPQQAPPINPQGKFGPYFETNAPWNFQNPTPVGPGITGNTADQYGWGLPNQSDVNVPMRRPNPSAPPVINPTAPIPPASPSDIAPGAPFPTQALPPQIPARRDLISPIPQIPSRMYPWDVNAPTYEVPGLPRRLPRAMTPEQIEYYKRFYRNPQ